MCCGWTLQKHIVNRRPVPVEERRNLKKNPFNFIHAKEGKKWLHICLLCCKWRRKTIVFCCPWYVTPLLSPPTPHAFPLYSCSSPKGCNGSVTEFNSNFTLLPCSCAICCAAPPSAALPSGHCPSKLRGFLKIGSEGDECCVHDNLSLCRGKHVWRLAHEKWQERNGKVAVLPVLARFSLTPFAMCWFF